MKVNDALLQNVIITVKHSMLFLDYYSFQILNRKTLNNV